MDVLPLLGPIDAEKKPDPWHPREVYLSLNKGFGAVPVEQLEYLVGQLEDSERPQDLECAASALTEAQIFSPTRTLETVDHDLAMVDYATYLLERAAAGYWNNLERGFQHYNDQSKAIRTEVSVAFANVYRDMVAGEISTLTREETYAQLARWGRYAHHLAKSVHGAYGEQAMGVSYEVATMLAALTTDDEIMLPSTPRAGSGFYHARDTHDFSFIELDETGYPKTIIPVELKAAGDSMIRLEAEGRYNPRSVVLLHARSHLGLEPDDLPRIFRHRSLTNSARRDLAPLRAGIHSSISAAMRQFGDEGIEQS